MSDIIKIKEEYLNKLKEISDVKEINQLKSELFGKSGKISNEFKKMGSLNSEDRKKTSSGSMWVISISGIPLIINPSSAETEDVSQTNALTPRIPE